MTKSKFFNYKPSVKMKYENCPKGGHTLVCYYSSKPGVMPN